MSDELDQDAVTTTTDEELDLDLNLDDSGDVETLKADLEKEREAKRQILARAKDAEAKLKSLQETKVTPKENINNLSGEDVEAKILKAQGMSDDLLSELKAIAKVRGKGLIDSQTDPIFLALKESREATEKAEKAKLGASKGSGQAKAQKDFNSAGLTDQDHKELWQKSQER